MKLLGVFIWDAADLAMSGQGPGVEGSQLTTLIQHHGLIGSIAGVRLETHVMIKGQLVHETWVGVNPRGLPLQRLQCLFSTHLLCHHQMCSHHLPKGHGQFVSGK